LDFVKSGDASRVPRRLNDRQSTQETNQPPPGHIETTAPLGKRTR
jgi:hypothetical protein